MCLPVHDSSSFPFPSSRPSFLVSAISNSQSEKCTVCRRYGGRQRHTTQKKLSERIFTSIDVEVGGRRCGWQRQSHFCRLTHASSLCLCVCVCQFVQSDRDSFSVEDTVTEGSHALSEKKTQPHETMPAKGKYQVNNGAGRTSPPTSNGTNGATNGGLPIIPGDLYEGNARFVDKATLLEHLKNGDIPHPVAEG